MYHQIIHKVLKKDVKIDVKGKKKGDSKQETDAVIMLMKKLNNMFINGNVLQLMDKFFYNS